MSREPFFGKNAKAFAVQFGFLLIFIFLLAGPIRSFIGGVLCDGVGFCSSEMERQQATERSPSSKHLQ